MGLLIYLPYCCKIMHSIMENEKLVLPHELTHTFPNIKYTDIWCTQKQYPTRPLVATVAGVEMFLPGRD